MKKKSVKFYKKKCDVCGKEFFRYNTLAKYCSQTCYGKHQTMKAKEKGYLAKCSCLICGEEFEPKRYNAKYCSKKCAGIAHRAKPKICKYCEKEYHPTMWRQKYCSPKCYTDSLRGKKTKRPTKVRKKAAVDVLWSKAVKHCCGNKCIICGEVKYLNSHHVIGRRNYSVRWELKNGVALCPKHHLFGVWSAHQNPVWFVERIRKQQGERWYAELRQKSHEIVHITEEFIQENHKKLKKYLANAGL